LASSLPGGLVVALPAGTFLFLGLFGGMSTIDGCSLGRRDRRREGEKNRREGEMKEATGGGNE
jgi:hypothetical protein